LFFTLASYKKRVIFVWERKKEKRKMKEKNENDERKV
tara:strand:- start:282 stop:392 length:111 start_codon:yes stop_codon:yes gene_type:complete